MREFIVPEPKHLRNGMINGKGEPVLIETSLAAFFLEWMAPRFPQGPKFARMYLSIADKCSVAPGESVKLEEEEWSTCTNTLEQIPAYVLGQVIAHVDAFQNAAIVNLKSVPQAAAE